MPAITFKLPGGKKSDVSDTPSDTQVLTFNSTKDQWDSQAGGIATDEDVQVKEAGTDVGVPRNLNFADANDFIIAEDSGNNEIDVSINRNSADGIPGLDSNSRTALAQSPIGTAFQRYRTNSGATAIENFTEEAGISFIIDGGGSAITTGIKGDLEIPFACTINRVTLLADQSGAIVIDIWKDTYANFPPTVADTITASAKPTIAASGVKDEDSTLTGWTTAIAAGDTLRYNVDSVATIERLTVTLSVNKEG